MTISMAPNKEFIISFMICFLVGILMMINYGAQAAAPLPSISVQADNGATNSWRVMRTRQNISIAAKFNKISTTGISAPPAILKPGTSANGSQSALQSSGSNIPTS